MLFNGVFLKTVLCVRNSSASSLRGRGRNLLAVVSNTLLCTHTEGVRESLLRYRGF